MSHKYGDIKQCPDCHGLIHRAEWNGFELDLEATLVPERVTVAPLQDPRPWRWVRAVKEWDHAWPGAKRGAEEWRYKHRCPADGRRA